MKLNSIWHTDTLSSFNAKVYDGLLRREHIVSNEMSKKYNENDYFGYVLEKDNPETRLKERYFVTSKFIPELPFKVLKSDKFSHRGEVYMMVTSCATQKIPSKKCMSFREMVDFYANYAHSNSQHWKIARIVVLACYIERINIRIVSPASFGKDALVDILKVLNGGVGNLYNATLAKLKYSLHNDLIVVNELGGLKSDEVMALQAYLTQAGAYKPEYENNSRGANGTKEFINLQNKSHIIYHNTPDYYESRGQQYFEQMFTHAIMDRFPAILVEGYVSENFSESSHIDEFQPSDVQQLKNFISSLNYYKQNKIDKPKFKIPETFWEFKGKELQRALRGFTTIAKYLSEYSETEKEFVELCSLISQCRKEYLKLVGDFKYKEEKLK